MLEETPDNCLVALEESEWHSHETKERIMDYRWEEVKKEKEKNREKTMVQEFCLVRLLGPILAYVHCHDVVFAWDSEWLPDIYCRW